MKEYRQNSHTLSLSFWAVLCAAVATVLLVHSHKVVSRSLKVEEIAAGLGLLVVGPAALAVYLIRARRIWVGVDHLRGIIVGGTRTLLWDEILRVERRRPAFRRSSGPYRVPEAPGRGALQGASGCAEFGCLAGLGEIFAGILLLIAAFYLIWLVFAVLIPLLLLPVVEVFAPFGDRITIVTRRGSLVLRDLRDADEFMSAVAQRRPVTER
jgi:hypothetical protein